MAGKVPAQFASLVLISLSAIPPCLPLRVSAPLRLCASAPLRLCASAPLRLCASAPLRAKLSHTGPGSTAISSYSYSYDAAGSITNWTQSQAGNTVLPVSAWNLRQNGSKQLTGVSVTGHPELAESYGYDAWGKRELLGGTDVASVGCDGTLYQREDRVVFMVKFSFLYILVMALVACSSRLTVHEENLANGSQFNLKESSPEWLSEDDLGLAKSLMLDFQRSKTERANDRLYLVQANIDKDKNLYYVFNVNESDLFVLYIIEGQKRIPVKRILAASFGKTGD